jgi:predicted ferric reductase
MPSRGQCRTIRADAQRGSRLRPASGDPRITPAQWLAAAGVAHAIAIGTAWWHVSGGLLFDGQPGGPAVALGRLAGLAMGSAVLLQLVLVSRLPVIEPYLGCDRLYRLHRRLGFAIGLLLLSHPALLIFGYARWHGLALRPQFAEIARDLPHVWPAIGAALVIVLVVALSTQVIRRRLSYEAWHAGHLGMYLALPLASLHQVNGAELSSQSWWAGYWVALHALVVGAFVVFRAGRPIFRFALHRFRIDKIVAESDDVLSIYVTGHHLDRFAFRPGQYANVSFLSKGLWAPHPFSFSAAPNGRFLRLSIKAVGDFTRRIHELRPGTFVLLEGPLGAFTATTSTRQKYLMVAGGIGITPIRALIESLMAGDRDVVLVYAVKTVRDLVFASELRALNAHFHVVLSRSAGTANGYEQGRVDRPMLERLVPDVRDREVFVCGPPPMMEVVIGALRALDVRASRIHYERFA